MSARLGYRASLDWLLDNDDTEWLNDADPIVSVTAVLVADIFGVSTEKVIRDLLRRSAAREAFANRLADVSRELRKGGAA